MPRLLPRFFFRFLHPPSARRQALRALALSGGLLLGGPAAAQTTISGTVLIAQTGEPAYGAEVMLLELGEVTHTDDEGRFEFVTTEENPDNHPVLTLHVDLGFLSGIHTIAVGAGEDTFELAEPILLEPGHRTHEEVTVTASASETSPFEAFGSVDSIEGIDLQNESARTLGELLQSTPGIAARSFGPGSARPIVRGFDGDRVLVMEDGIRTGDLGSQSGDHGVPVDPLQAERIEVVRGPATLLYGSNAIGGAVNVISMGSHLAHSPPSGFRGQANLDFSNADRGVRGGTRAQAVGNGWAAWGGGNAHRTSDYDSPAGVVENTAGWMQQGEAGFGLFGDRAWFSGNIRLDESRYGVPFAGAFHGLPGEADLLDEEEELEVDVAMHRRQFRTDFGIHDLGTVFEEAEFTVRYADFEQDEIETVIGSTVDEIATTFENRSLVLRGELRRAAGQLHSRLGAWGHLRNYEAAGEEALSPETRQNALALFSYNEIHAGNRLSLLFGARVEHNAYDAGDRPAAEGHAHEEEEDHEEEQEPPAVVDRSFLGASASSGVRFSLSEEHAVVATASYSTRAPSLEELYNFGPHVGNLAFEIGNPSLDPERSFGLDLSLRRSSPRLSGSINLFRYDIADFIFGAATGTRQGALQVLEFLQSDATYQGFETEIHLRFRGAELEGNVSYVNAKLTGTDEFAPRIPPLGGQVKLDVPIGRLRLVPRLRWAARMDRLYQGETVTDGYAVLDLTASYVFVRTRTTSNLSLRAYNLTDAEYRHHTSLIKDLAPQIGRGFRISYSLRFF